MLFKALAVFSMRDINLTKVVVNAGLSGQLIVDSLGLFNCLMSC